LLLPNLFGLATTNDPRIATQEKATLLYNKNLTLTLERCKALDPMVKLQVGAIFNFYLNIKKIDSKARGLCKEEIRRAPHSVGVGKGGSSLQSC